MTCRSNNTSNAGPPPRRIRDFSPLSTLHSPLFSPGFTFIEVLFAIIILGIGSIMIAGMLPVAIKQSSDTRNAITGKAACEAGYAYVQAIAAMTQYTLVDTAAISIGGLNASSGHMVPLTAATIANNAGVTAAPGPTYAMQSLTGSRVLTSDPRSQWVAFYGRAPGSSFAKLVVLGLHLQNTEQQQSYAKINDTTPSNCLANGFNDPLLMTAYIKEGGALDPDTCVFPTSNSAQSLNAADTGAFVIVANSPAPSGNTDNGRPSRNNGRVFRLGTRRVDLDATNNGQTYELQPGYDLPPTSAAYTDSGGTVHPQVDDTSMDSSTITQVWVVGKGLQNTNLIWDQTTNPYVGLVQDVGVLTTQVQLSN